MASSESASPGARPAGAGRSETRKDHPRGAGRSEMAKERPRGTGHSDAGGDRLAAAGRSATGEERLAGADFERWRSFQALGEELHFTRAAARLHLTQPALSQHIRALERQLGAALVVRHARGCALTPIGERVFEEATRMLADADAAAARIRAAVRGREGRLRLAYTRSARGGRVDALVARFRREHPQVEVVPETGWTAPNVAGLLAGRFDAAFVRPPLDEPALVCRHLDSEELLLAVPASHPLATRRRIGRPEIVGLPAVMWPRENGPGMFDRTIAQVWPAGGFHLVRHEPDDEQLLRAVAEGTVIAAVPAGRARALKVPGVRLRRFTEPVPTVEIALAYPADTTNPAVHHLAALLDTPSH